MKEPTIVVAARLPATQVAQVRQLAAARDERPSDVLRRAITEALARRATEPPHPTAASSEA